MAVNAKLLVEQEPALCKQCHREIVEAAQDETGHYPAGESCLNCHEAHASEQDHILTAGAGELCASCHDVEDADLVRAHLGAELTGPECTGCHTPHGGENPSLLAANLHAPLLDGCDTCHEGAAGQVMEDGESSLCLMCHDDIGEAAEQAEVPHAALEVARCADCHNAHASAQEHLVKKPGGAVCVECHEDQAPSGDEVAHGVIELIGCRACHEPHGGNRPSLLRGTGNELCLSCHDPARVVRDEDGSVVVLDRFRLTARQGRAVASLRLSPDGQHGHPVTKHRVLGTPTEAELNAVETTFQGELTCLTCHDPHKAPSSLLLRWNAASTFEACLQCHPK
jgi:predicted CXXCH cytochrome family protein